ncbi:MAG TPA: DUF4124 domain-containing protein [Usitatibacter sp.]|nr:DUF4124 domain-containing protein [Usitatibacter sp.]
MKIVWIAGIALASAGSALAQTTIYKHVDESGHVTYSNRPMKGATVLDLDPLTTVPGLPAAQVQQAIAQAPAKPVAVLERLDTPKTDAKAAPAQAPIAAPTNIASIEPQVQKKREDDRKRILEDELSRGGAVAHRGPRFDRAGTAEPGARRRRAHRADGDRSHSVANGGDAQFDRESLGPHPWPAGDRRRAREEHRGAQERARRAEVGLASRSSPSYRQIHSADAPASPAGALLAPSRPCSS